MDIYIPSRRDTLLIPSGPSHDPNRLHLHVILTNASLDPSDSIMKLLLVGFTSLAYDTSCILRVGEHRFVQHDSFMDYANAKLTPVNTVIRQVQEGALRRQPPVSEDVFSRICQGLKDSDHTAPRYLDFFWQDR